MSYCRVAAFDGQDFTIIPNELGNTSTPAIVAFTEDGVLVGEKAKEQQPLNPKNTIFNFKRLIGRRFSDPLLQQYMRTLTFKIE